MVFLVLKISCIKANNYYFTRFDEGVFMDEKGESWCHEIA